MTRGAWVLVATLAVGACGTLRGVHALRDVDATLDRVVDVRLGGVRLGDVESPRALSPLDVAGLTAGTLAGRLPLACTAIVRIENPATKRVTAELLRTRWTLRVGDRDVAGGAVDRRYSIAPGQAVEVPLRVAVDLADVLERDTGTLLRLALALAGDGRSPVDVQLRLVPILDTPLGGVPTPAITVPLLRAGR